MKLFFLLIIAFLTSSVINSYGQSCSISVSDAPKLRGFYLGMKDAEIRKVFPFAKIPKADQFGYREFAFTFVPDNSSGYDNDTPANWVDPDEFPDYQGWKSIKVEMIDDSVVALEIEYEDGIKWKNVADFVKEFSKASKLPSKWTEINPDYYTQVSIKCNGFNVEVEMTGNSNPVVYIFRTEALKILKQRKAAAEENQKKTFKP